MTDGDDNVARSPRFPSSKFAVPTAVLVVGCTARGCSTKLERGQRACLHTGRGFAGSRQDRSPRRLGGQCPAAAVSGAAQALTLPNATRSGLSPPSSKPSDGRATGQAGIGDDARHTLNLDGEVSAEDHEDLPARVRFADGNPNKPAPGLSRAIALPRAISVRGARQNNLQGTGVDVDEGVPLWRTVAAVGVSGSGKTSLAIGTLYAEGSQGLLEGLSTYSRRRLIEVRRPDSTRSTTSRPPRHSDSARLYRGRGSTVRTMSSPQRRCAR